MAEPPLSPAAALVRRLDPVQFRAALFAPEPARERLMVLAAFDIELSRAVARAPGREEGPLLAAMRLQFWRDRVEEAGSDTTPAADHEVAGPLHALLSGPLAPDREAALSLVDARHAEMEAPLDRAAWEGWARARFEAWHRLALRALDLLDPEAALAAGRLAAAGFALRHARAMAREGATLIPDLDEDARAALAAGRPSEGAGRAIATLAAIGREAATALHARRPALGRAATPAMLPLGRDRRVIAAAEAGATLDHLAAIPAPGALPQLWTALSGRW